MDPWEDPTRHGPGLLPAEGFLGETCRGLQEKERKAQGEYRTRRLVLEAWGRQVGVEVEPQARPTGIRQAERGDRVPKPDEHKQHVPVFVGSTYEDLKPYRAAVTDALVRLEYTVRGMEYFGSKPGSPKEECLKAVQSCRVYIGIFAMRYGSVDEETGKSMTHLECDEAQRLKLPTLIYLLDEQNQPVLAGHVDTGENAHRLRNLKDELKRQFIVSFFTTPEDLARRVVQDLPPMLAVQAAGEARQEAGKADLASKVARVYYSLSAVLAMRFGGYMMFRQHALQLLALAERDAIVSFREYANLSSTSDAAPEASMSPDGPPFEIARQLAAEGLIELSGSTPEDAHLRVAPQFAEPIRMAFGYLRQTEWEPSPAEGH